MAEYGMNLDLDIDRQFPWRAGPATGYWTAFRPLVGLDFYLIR